MNGALTVLALIAAVVIALVPLAAVVLVSIASLHEESARTLSGSAPNLAARAARQLLGFRDAGRPAAGHQPTTTKASKPGREVRFAYASQLVPDPGEQPAVRELGPGEVCLDQRQPAGV